MTKYHAKPEEVDGYRFDSGAEARRYRELRMLEAAGEVECIDVHPRFLILDGFTHRDRKYRPTFYEADFRYRTRQGQVIVEDVKGMETAAFKLKHKMLLSRYPYLDFRVVKA